MLRRRSGRGQKERDRQMRMSKSWTTLRFLGSRDAENNRRKSWSFITRITLKFCSSHCTPLLAQKLRICLLRLLHTYMNLPLFHAFSICVRKRQGGEKEVSHKITDYLFFIFLPWKISSFDVLILFLNHKTLRVTAHPNVEARKSEDSQGLFQFSLNFRDALMAKAVT